jgi:hypothetical protein
MSTLRLRPERGRSGDAQDNLKTTDPTASQRGRLT